MTFARESSFNRNKDLKPNLKKCLRQRVFRDLNSSAPSEHYCIERTVSVCSICSWCAGTLFFEQSAGILCLCGVLAQEEQELQCPVSGNCNVVSPHNEVLCSFPIEVRGHPCVLHQGMHHLNCKRILGHWQDEIGHAGLMWETKKIMF